jgi:hypothetical protein
VANISAARLRESESSLKISHFPRKEKEFLSLNKALVKTGIPNTSWPTPFVLVVRTWLCFKPLFLVRPNINKPRISGLNSIRGETLIRTNLAPCSNPKLLPASKRCLFGHNFLINLILMSISRKQKAFDKLMPE